MKLIAEHKWVILLLLEAAAWTSTFFMLYARYRMEAPIWFRAGALLTVITGVIPQVLLGVINYWTSRELDLFTALVVLLIMYGATIGRKQIKRLDLWAQRKFAKSA